MSKEYSPDISINQQSVITIASEFSQLNLEMNDKGYQNACEILIEQHKRISFPFRETREDLLQLATNESNTTQFVETRDELGIDVSNYYNALTNANNLFNCAQKDIQESLNYFMFNFALKNHRKLFNNIYVNFKMTDPLLTKSGIKILNELEMVVNSNDQVNELHILRGVIHRIALNGTLGDEAKKCFDPFALVILLEI